MFTNITLFCFVGIAELYLRSPEFLLKIKMGARGRTGIRVGRGRPGELRMELKCDRGARGGTDIE